MEDFPRLAKHQLRTPLTLIRGYLSFMESGDFQKFPAEKQKEIIAKMAAESEKLNLLINDVFLSLQIEKGLTTKPEPIKLKKLIEDIHNQTLKPNYDKKNLVLDIKDDSQIEINSDTFYLTIVLQKILDNAEKYSLSGQVDINISKKDNYAIIEIKDSGIGLTDEEKPKIFHRFFRGLKAKEIWPDGSGLGLEIIKGIIKTLDGEISAESEGRDKGTKFIIKLPI
ncbi:MAG: HAMP domain-containing sensor histidine kinase [Patescibacteria group bacterium]